MCPRFFAAQKLGSGPLLRALPRDPHSNTTRRASLDLKLGITTVTEAGARLLLACRIAGIDARTLQCWQAHEGLVKGDGGPQAVRPTPCHALRLDDRAILLSVTNESRFCVVPPARIVPMSAYEGVHLANESSLTGYYGHKDKPLTEDAPKRPKQCDRPRHTLPAQQARSGVGI